MARMTFEGNEIGAPEWMKDFSSRDHLMPFPAKLDYTLFKDAIGIPVIVATGGAAQGATAIPVTAIAYPFTAAITAVAQGATAIKSGAVLDFGGGKFARLTADALIGDVSLAVSALPTALVAGDAAVHSPYLTDVIPGGTMVSRTYAQRAANAPFHPAITTDDEIYLTAFDVTNARINGDVELYRPPSVVAENYLPGYTTILNPAGTPSALLTALRGIYKCIIGVD